LKPLYIIVHHSESPDGATLDWSAIRRYHIDHNGWQDIGYHYGVEKINGVVEVLVGRMQDQNGAHCNDAGMNHQSLGICVVGNYDLAPPSLEVWNKTITLVASLCRVFSIPVENIKGHRDYHDKTCPGTQFNLDTFRTGVSSILHYVI
jgi:N-acetylmuramoyl-L-alanine amidase